MNRELDAETEPNTSLFGESEKSETSPESQPEIKADGDDADVEGEKSKDETTPSEESTKKEPPFHDHPRFKQLIEERNEMRDTVDRLQQEIDKLSSETKEITQKQDHPVDIPKWFSNVYGDDPNAWTQYQSYQKQERELIKKEILDEQAQSQKTTELEIQKTTKWINSEIEKLEDEGLVFDRDEFYKVMQEFRPVNASGVIDFRKVYEILQEKKEIETLKEERKKGIRKNIGGLTFTSHKGDVSKEDYQTPKTLRGKDWRDFVKL